MNVVEMNKDTRNTSNQVAGDTRPSQKAGKKAPSRKASGAKSRSAHPRRSAAREMTAKDKHLVIVESPAKARTLERYLGKDFRVMASIGHVVDLPKTKLGVDIENDFEPQYTVIKGKKTILNNLKREARHARSVYLAPDPDREGEAIAHHIAQELKSVNDDIYRATFNEITQRAVQRGIQNPRTINENLFKAQQARRVLDRLVGYKLSPLLWTKVRRGLSAGRVQSVAVRLICDREREINKFEPQEYWSIEGQAHAEAPPPFHIKLARKSGESIQIPNQAAADAILEELERTALRVSNVIKKEVSKRPFPPFITSTLQQEVSRKLRLPAKRTMTLAQRLYEGVELGELGHVALITYMRTDSTRLSDEAIGQARDYIGNQFGKSFLPDRARAYGKQKGAQDAHEAIRPTDISLTPERVAPYLDPSLRDLYTLIWLRTVASQMSDARIERTRIEIQAGDYLFTATGSNVVFEGFLRVYQEARDEAGKTESDNAGDEPVRLEDDEPLPLVETGQMVRVESMEGKQHFTQPPPRFTEAGLIRELERQGIGRPSTYASIISTIQDKAYVNKQKGAFRPSELGYIITDLLSENFPHIMDVKFTAMMEDQLDRVEEGSVDWVELLSNFYGPFSQRLEEAAVHMRNIKREVEPTDHVCEKCGSPMVIRWGRNGKFLACSAFPKCRNTRPVEVDEAGNVRVLPQEETDRVCPECGRPMQVKRGRRGRFLACTGYPECKTTQPYPIGIQCPREDCDGELVERRSSRGVTFYSCNRFPECRFSLSERPFQEMCEQCDKRMDFVERDGHRRVLCCAQKSCKYEPINPDAKSKGQDKSKRGKGGSS